MNRLVSQVLLVGLVLLELVAFQQLLVLLTEESCRLYNTVCPRSSCPFYIVSYYIKRGTTSWTYSNKPGQALLELHDPVSRYPIKIKPLYLVYSLTAVRALQFECLLYFL